MSVNWYKSSDIIDIRDGTHESPKYHESGIPLLTSKNLISGKLSLEGTNLISEKDYNAINQRSKVDKGDILYSMIGSIGNYALVEEEPYYAIKNVALFKFSKNIIINRYFYYLLNSQIIKSQIKSAQRGGTQSFISLSVLRNLQIPVPSKEEQQQVINLLDDMKNVKEKRTRSLEILNNLTQSIFLDMFGDPIGNEKNWEIKTLGELSSTILSGSTPKGGNRVYVEEGVLFLRSQNVWRNNLVLDDVAYITEETHNQMRNSSLEYKDLLMTKTGRINTENSSLGRVALYLGETDRANINGHVYLIRLNKDILHEFILFILTTSQYRDYIRRTCVGGIDKRQVNKIHLEQFPIIYPPIEKQKEFISVLSNTYEQKKTMQNSLSGMEDLYQSTIQKVFSEVIA